MCEVIGGNDVQKCYMVEELRDMTYNEVGFDLCCFIVGE